MKGLQEKIDKVDSETPYLIQKDCSGDWWLRYDTDDSDPKEQWENYIMVQDDLRDYGLKLDDAQIEHDCISGDVMEIDHA